MKKFIFGTVSFQCKIKCIYTHSHLNGIGCKVVLKVGISCDMIPHLTCCLSFCYTSTIVPYLPYAVGEALPTRDHSNGTRSNTVFDQQKKIVQISQHFLCCEIWTFVIPTFQYKGGVALRVDGSPDIYLFMFASVKEIIQGQIVLFLDKETYEIPAATIRVKMYFYQT